LLNPFSMQISVTHEGSPVRSGDQRPGFESIALGDRNGLLR